MSKRKQETANRCANNTVDVVTLSKGWTRGYGDTWVRAYFLAVVHTDRNGHTEIIGRGYPDMKAANAAARTIAQRLGVATSVKRPLNAEPAPPAPPRPANGHVEVAMLQDKAGKRHRAVLHIVDGEPEIVGLDYATADEAKLAAWILAHRLGAATGSIKRRTRP